MGSQQQRLVQNPPRCIPLPGLTFVEQVARSGSTSLSSRCSTALGQSVDSRASMMKVSIYTRMKEKTALLGCTGWPQACSEDPLLGLCGHSPCSNV